MSEQPAGLGRWLPARPLRRRAFWAFAAVLFTATHWPRLEVPHVVIERTDIVLHIGAFCVWTLLLIGTEYLGPLLNRRAIGWCWLIGLASAGLDEGLQAIPLVNRTCAWDDWGANAAGVTVAALVAVGYAWRSSRA